MISRHAGHLIESRQDVPGHRWSLRDSGLGDRDEREIEGTDHKKEKKKKKRKPKDDVFDQTESKSKLEMQSENIDLLEGSHQMLTRKERDRDEGWQYQDISRAGGRIKKGKSRKKIPEEWAIHAEPFVPTSPLMSHDFGTELTTYPVAEDIQACGQSLISLTEDYPDEGLMPSSLASDLLSLTASSPLAPVEANLAAHSAKSHCEGPSFSTTSHLSGSSGFPDRLMETDSGDVGSTKDAFTLPVALSKADPHVTVMNPQCFVPREGAFEEVMFEQEPSFIDPTVGTHVLANDPVVDPLMSTPGKAGFGSSMEALISAPPFSPSQTAWSLNGSNLNNQGEIFDVSGMEGTTYEEPVPVPLPSPNSKTLKETKSKQNRKTRSSSTRSPTSSEAKLHSPQNSGLNPAAPPFFPSFAEPREHVTDLPVMLQGLFLKGRIWIHSLHDLVDPKPCLGCKGFGLLGSLPQPLTHLFPCWTSHYPGSLKVNWLGLAYVFEGCVTTKKSTVCMCRAKLSSLTTCDPGCIILTKCQLVCIVTGTHSCSFTALQSLCHCLFLLLGCTGST